MDGDNSTVKQINMADLAFPFTLSLHLYHDSTAHDDALHEAIRAKKG
jgi:hypothetical protein